MQRRKFSREFKLEAVKLVRDRGVTMAQAARDLDLHINPVLTVTYSRHTPASSETCGRLVSIVMSWERAIRTALPTRFAGRRPALIMRETVRVERRRYWATSARVSHSSAARGVAPSEAVASTCFGATRTHAGKSDASDLSMEQDVSF
jgi:transposase-like protein